MKVEKKYPPTFYKMLNSPKGTLQQRIIKKWITPINPEGTIKLLERLNVHKFQGLMLKIIMEITESTGKDPVQSGYTLGRTDLNSMIDYATNQSTANEAIHLAGTSIGIYYLLLALAIGKIDMYIFPLLAVTAMQIYCVLAQRYSRARLSIIIDKAFAKQKKFKSHEYFNSLDIELPENNN